MRVAEPLDPAGLLLLSSKQDSGEFIDNKLDFMGLSEKSGYNVITEG